MGGCGIAIKKRGSPIVMLLMMESSTGENVTLPPLHGRRPSSMLVLRNQASYLPTVGPLNLIIEFGPGESARRSCVSHLQLPLFSVQLLHLVQDLIKAGVLMPPMGKFGFETYISKPLDGIVHFFGKRVRFFIK